MKKFISIILSILILFSTTNGLSVTINAADTTKGETDDYVYYYTEETGTAFIEKYTGTATEVKIPDKINGYEINRIGNNAFYLNSKITSVTMPEGIESIGGNAFAGCQKLEYINIPESVTEIGMSAFDGCRKLADITIPENVTKIAERAFCDTAYYNNEANWDNDVLYMGNFLIEAKNTLSGDYEVKQGTVNIADFAFWECTDLSSITFADSVKRIGICIVAHCSNLTSIEIQENVEFIDMRAFMYATALKSITIPASVEFIGQEAFSKCYSLEEINVASENDNYSSLNGVLFNKNKTTLVEYPCGLKGDYVIPDTVTTIGLSAADDCTGLTNIRIPESVTTIEDTAFCNVGFSSITIPANVVNIGKNAIGFITNPDSDVITLAKGFTIFGYSGSSAEYYATYNNINFVTTGQTTEPEEPSDVKVSTPSYAAPATDPNEKPKETTPSTFATDPTEPTKSPTAATKPITKKKVLKATIAKTRIQAGETTKIKVTGKQGTVKFKSLTPEIAKVNKKGVVTGLYWGQVRIKVTSGKKSVIVKAMVYNYPTLSEERVNLVEGRTVSVRITGKAKNTKVIFPKCKIAKFSVKGNRLVIKGKKPGQAQVFVRVNGYPLFLVVTVAPSPDRFHAMTTGKKVCT